jgi:hypothetical protein
MWGMFRDGRKGNRKRTRGDVDDNHTDLLYSNKKMS